MCFVHVLHCSRNTNSWYIVAEINEKIKLWKYRKHILSLPTKYIHLSSKTQEPDRRVWPQTSPVEVTHSVQKGPICQTVRSWYQIDVNVVTWIWRIRNSHVWVELHFPLKMQRKNLPSQFCKSTAWINKVQPRLQSHVRSCVSLMYISDTNVNDSCDDAACAVSISGSVLHFMEHMAVVFWTFWTSLHILVETNAWPLQFWHLLAVLKQANPNLTVQWYVFVVV